MNYRLLVLFAVSGCVLSLVGGCGTFNQSASVSPPSRTTVVPEVQVQVSSTPLKSELPMEENPAIDSWVRRFSGRDHKSFQTQLDRSVYYVVPGQEIFVRKGLPKDLVFLALVESGFSPTARSHANAVGMWQIISKTGTRFGLEQNEWFDERRHPMKAAQAAADYLSFLFDTFGSWPLALAGYNAGENAVQRAIDNSGSKDFWVLAENGYLPAETRDYVPKLYGAVTIIRSPARYGFQYDPAYHIARHETVPVPGGVKLSWIEKQIGAPEDSLAYCNPELCKPVTPPVCSQYELCVPIGTGSDVLAVIANCTPQEEKNERKAAAAAPPVAGAAQKSPASKTYRTSRGDSWLSVAAKYRCSAKMLAELNGMKTSQPLKIGKTLKVPAGEASPSVSVARAPSSKPAVNASSGNRKPAAAAQKPVRYVVRKGDTLRTIAEKFRIPLKNLCAQNDLKLNQKLVPGNHLVIYAAQQDPPRMAKRKN
ncbi:MAG: transglycosylase SLT domain-containing protein [Syntrophobacteraceae bacterium]